VDIEPADEGVHADCIDEWWFGWWLPDGSAGMCGHRSDPATRVLGYWWVWRAPGEPFLHISDWNVPMRSSSGLVKGDLLWAEHLCEAAHEQWTVSNESLATAVDDPLEILRSGFGESTPIASDVEWYATSRPTPLTAGAGYQQVGVVHGLIEVASRRPVEIVEASAWRCHRWWSRGSDPIGEIFPQQISERVDAVIAGPDRSSWMFYVDVDGWAEVIHPLSDGSSGGARPQERR